MGTSLQSAYIEEKANLIIGILEQNITENLTGHISSYLHYKFLIAFHFFVSVFLFLKKFVYIET